MIELVVFLGNPGPEYAANRHNAPWLLARRLPFYDRLSWRDKFKGRYAFAEGSVLLPYAAALGGEEFPPPESGTGQTPPASAEKIHFLMPGTYMNLSGESALAAASFYKILPQNTLIVHDELELPLGTVSLKFSGGLGGHNGLRSVKASFAGADFWRLRIGIGRPDDRLPGQGGSAGSGRGILEWVLSDFTAGERPLLEISLDAAAGLLTRLMVNAPEPFLSQWAKKKIGPDSPGP